jgi:uncharacterized protein involved in tolerance to divalent cations
MGLKELSKLKNLQSIYCWQSKITVEGKKVFAKTNAKAKVELGEGVDK